ncbi:GNAT family N-acetyltransferase [Denitrobaculum tricleocarpae]|uniref:GNAT family N-acetyltransferase n=1 Tax=Denitrobaculum tricleocarpae TaxID=2591009 RepID=A0A545TYI0_9PROT|nr:GNAT family N-acetyltransferase [Denitrobaculum tricleocarpae]TQV82233.1 GNAT family N-acetyltransferase [Denitrobaculum tricleocarpae]
MQLTIRKDDLSGEFIAQLLQKHLDFTAGESPPESSHALDLEALRAPDITFWCAWDGDSLLGCVALKDLGVTDGVAPGGARHGEVKSMHTAEAARGRGVARALMEHLMAEARRLGYARLSLETGSMESFAAARRLYARFGFETCAPFGDYVLDPHSEFMTIELAA